jgi:hypothetical protein
MIKLQDASNINNNSTFIPGLGTIEFTGTGVSTVSGTIALNKVILRKGVTFNNGSTINNSLEIRAGGYVATGAPAYAANSTLVYNVAANYGRGTEWSALSSRGYPHHVEVKGGATLDLTASHGIAPSLAASYHCKWFCSYNEQHRSAINS